MTNQVYTGANPGLIADWIMQKENSFTIVPDRERGETLLVNLRTRFGKSVEFLPAWNVNPDEKELPGEATQDRRIQVLLKIQRQQVNHLVVPVRGFTREILSPSTIETLELDTGITINMFDLINRLETLGFNREELVESSGDYAHRGDLLDIFPRNTPYPIRVSFFDDEIEAIDYFHPNTQMQANEDPSLPITLVQHSEFALTASERKTLKDSLRTNGYNQAVSNLERHNRPDQIADWFDFWPRPTTPLEQLQGTTNFVIFEPGECWSIAKTWDKRVNDDSNRLTRDTCRNLRTVLKDLVQDSQPVEFFEHFEDSPITLNQKPHRYGKPVYVSSNPTGGPNPISDFIDLIRDLTEKVRKISVHCGEDGFRERLAELIEDNLDSVNQHNETSLNLRDEAWHGSYQRNGFARVSLDDFFNRTIQRGRIGPDRGKTEYLESFEELQPEDLVVHEHFGIGKFHGLKRIDTENQTRDCLHIEYADNDKLFLPPDQIAWVQKYIADSGYSPTLSKLSGGNWSRILENVEEEISDLAQELMELYSLREESSGYSYPDDSLEQKQFEASFPYRETADQQEAIEAVKSDMKSNETMDRLICGDSGFGKTEVALRAAFKAVDNDRQVAMLVPTTILARQHYETFSNRFSFFPYSVEMMSRFQTNKEIEATIQSLDQGETDVVIGTHRLLSDDVTFDNLGLLIIDEEQRFGVEQKESIKFENKDLDFLTLSATPIPRTLYMTLSGVQDISRINTPPEERVSIDIEVSPFDVDSAVHSLDREISRNGQVFWVYNRVRDIEQRAEYVTSLKPDVSVGIAHGQMKKSKLRSTMNDFYAGKIDILVCTTIIENGIDCPNVNTMIIEDAHQYGLAQLYQLRGRVGRSNKQAYVNMFYSSDDQLTKDAKSRLQAIKQCSELGAGFQLAMRDLEIRGAGNILGTKQHGNIRAVGFPLYCRMLQREIRKLREEFEIPKPFPKLKFPGEHYFPEEYIPAEKQRIKQYQQLSECRNLAQVEEIETKWCDTFGPLPEPVKQILNRHRFKILADKNGWDDFRYRDQQLNLRFQRDPPEILIEASRRVEATTKVRNNRLLINRLFPEKISDWLQEIETNTTRREPIRN